MTTKQERAEQFSKELNTLLAAIRDKAVMRFHYNEDTNIPKGRVEASESVGNAIRAGVCSAVNTASGFDCQNACEYAEAILEGANCHAEVRALAAMVQS